MGKPSEKNFNIDRDGDIPHSTTWIKRKESDLWSNILRRRGLAEYIRISYNRHWRLTVLASESDLSVAHIIKWSKHIP